MLVHPLLRTLAVEPQAALEHAAGYLQLAREEAGLVLAHSRKRLLLGLLAAALGLIALALGGVALLLLAVHPLDAVVRPGLLWAVPALPLAAAVLLWVWLRASPAPPHFPALRAQWSEDLALMDEAGSRP